MKLKIKQARNGRYHHVWDSESSTSAMVVFGSIWATDIALTMTGQISLRQCGLTILVTLFFALPCLIAIMNVFAKRIPIPADHAKIKQIEREIYPSCQDCKAILYTELDRLMHECPIRSPQTAYEHWYARKPEPPEWGSSSVADIRAYEVAKHRWALQRPPRDDPSPPWSQLIL